MRCLGSEMIIMGGPMPTIRRPFEGHGMRATEEKGQWRYESLKGIVMFGFYGSDECKYFSLLSD